MAKKYTLEELYRKGLLNASVIKYRDINTKMNEMKGVGMRKGAAVRYVAELCNCSIQTVYNALKLKQLF